MNPATSRPDTAPAPTPPAIGPAVVLASEGRQAVVRDEGSGETFTAGLGADCEALRAGDRLLVARGRSGAWALSVLSAIRPVALVASDGVEARLERDRILIRDAEGRLLFEHRADEGVSVIHAPHGDLRLSAPAGNIELEALKDVKIRGRRQVSLGRDDDNSLLFDRTGAHLRTRLFEASAAVARLVFVDTSFGAASVTSAVQTVKQTVGLLQTTAARIVTNSTTSFTEVEQLAQTRVGRLRQIARGSAQFIAKTMLVKAKEDVSIKGDKIHLA
ncbi:MAG TPA: DUF3540 domain-containing protein [Polyangiaceae bacterium]|nr:DUF3540 domain-containing protein [Polyangiaceae bacterium]